MILNERDVISIVPPATGCVALPVAKRQQHVSAEGVAGERFALSSPEQRQLSIYKPAGKTSSSVRPDNVLLFENISCHLYLNSAVKTGTLYKTCANESKFKWFMLLSDLFFLFF